MIKDTLHENLNIEQKELEVLLAVEREYLNVCLIKQQTIQRIIGFHMEGISRLRRRITEIDIMKNKMGFKDEPAKNSSSG